MAIKVEGLKELEAELEKRFSKDKMEEITDVALFKGAQVIYDAIRSNLEPHKATGATYDEVTISKPVTLNGTRTIRIYWKGPMNRYRIIHLNEHGTIRNPNPKSKGEIDRALKRAREVYFETVSDYIGKMVRGESL